MAARKQTPRRGTKRSAADADEIFVASGQHAREAIQQHTGAPHDEFSKYGVVRRVPGGCYIVRDADTRHKVFFKYITEDEGELFIEYWGDRRQNHRNDGPATTIYRLDGSIRDIIYYENNLEHRTDGPAITEFHANGRVARIAYAKREQFHRVGGPAVIRFHADGTMARRTYYMRDQRHREGAPAEEEWDQEGRLTGESYHHIGKRHRLGGPAERTWQQPGNVLTHEAYYVDGIAHRTDGPAVVHYRPHDGTLKSQMYYRRGVKQRVDGPAVIRYYPTGNPLWEEYYHRGELHRTDGFASIGYRDQQGVSHISSGMNYRRGLHVVGENNVGRVHFFPNGDQARTYYSDQAGTVSKKIRVGADGRIISMRGPMGHALDPVALRRAAARGAMMKLRAGRAFMEEARTAAKPTSVRIAQMAGRSVRDGGLHMAFRVPRSACAIDRKHYDDPSFCHGKTRRQLAIGWGDPARACQSSFYSDHQLRGYLAGLLGLPGADNVDKKLTREELCRRIAEWK